jgi:FKBP-type peptidyl-prolyl cis-trans isomerase FkpA
MNRTLSLTLTLAFACAMACSAAGGGAGKADISTDEQKTYYALGVSMGQNLARGALSGLKEEQIAAVQMGLGDALATRTPQVDMPTFGPKIQQMMQARQQEANKANVAAAGEEKKKGEAFQDTAAKEAGAEKTASGMIYKQITAGTGATPAATDTVKVSYEGKLIDGTVFDASEKHGGPATFALNRVVPCWTEGVQKMKVGGKAQLVCPSSIAYGDTGHPPTIPGGSTLVFTVELISIEPPGPKQPMPPGMAMGAMGGRPPGVPGMMHGPPPGQGMMQPQQGGIQVHPMTPPPAQPAPAPQH